MRSNTETKVGGNLDSMIRQIVEKTAIRVVEFLVQAEDGPIGVLVDRRSDLDPPIVSGDEKVVLVPEVRLQFYYPLAVPVEVRFEKQGGFDRRDLVEAVRSGYEMIYAWQLAPDAVDPAMRGRVSVPGPYGVWGHEIGDLTVFGIEETEPGVFRVRVGS